MPTGMAPRLPLLPRGALTHAEAGQQAMPGDPATVQREWTGGGQWSTAVNDAAVPGGNGTEAPPVGGDNPVLRDVAFPLLQFLRGNREWLVGGIAALAVLVGAVKALRRHS
jgi:hypothetical protein